MECADVFIIQGFNLKTTRTAQISVVYFVAIFEHTWVRWPPAASLRNSLHVCLLLCVRWVHVGHTSLRQPLPPPAADRCSTGPGCHVVCGRGLFLSAGRPSAASVGAAAPEWLHESRTRWGDAAWLVQRECFTCRLQNQTFLEFLVAPAARGSLRVSTRKKQIREWCCAWVEFNFF